MSKKEISNLNFKSIHELNKFVDKVKINNISTQLQCKQHCKSASDIFKKAEAYYSSKDEENAYILYMRCLNTYMAIRKSYEFTKSKDVMEQLLVSIDPKTCISNAEKLLKILEVRYEKKAADLKKLRDIEKFKASQKNNTTKVSVDDLDNLILPEVPTGFNEKKDETLRQPPSNLDNIDNDTIGVNEKNEQNNDIKKKPSKDLISVLDFYDMLKVNKNKLSCILIIDIRKHFEFLKWRIQHEHTINIPPTCLPRDANRNSLERQIPKDIWDIWNTKFEREFIIIVNDTFDETEKPEALITHPAVVLQEILCKCEGEYTVLILKGGLQKWAIHYPTLTINPDLKRMNDSTSDLDVTALLEELGSYPTLPSTEARKKMEEEKNNLNKQNDENDRLAKMRNLLNENQNNEKGLNNLNTVEGTIYPSLENVTKKTPLVSNLLDAKTKEQISNDFGLNAKIDSKEEPVSLNEKSRDVQVLPNTNVNKQSDSVKHLDPRKRDSTKDVNPAKPVNQEIKSEPITKPINNLDKQPINKKTLNTTPGLPDGWVKQVDKKTGKIYYIDHNTKTTHWKLPDLNTNNKINELDSKMSPRETLSSQKPTVNQVEPSLPAIVKQISPSATKTSTNDIDQQNQAKLTPKSTVDPTATIQKPQSENSFQAPSITVQQPAQPLQPSAQVRQNKQTPQEQPLKPVQKFPTGSQPKPILPQDKVIQPNPQQPGTQAPLQQQSQNLVQPKIPQQQQQPTQTILKSSVKPQQPVQPPNTQKLQKPTQNIPPTTSVKQNETKVPNTSHTLVTPKQPSLKRSNSSPNLADGLENMRANRTKTPIVDRMSKPPSMPAKDTKPTHLIDRSSKPISAGRLRSLAPVYGSQGMSLTGLKNMGNTCYMNSVLQCLLNTPPLARYFVSGMYERDMNTGRSNINARPGHMAREFSFIMKVLSSGAYRSVSPIDFKLSLGSMAERFLTYEQQDSHEVLLIVLDGLHNDVNKATTKTAIPDRDNSKLSDNEAAIQEWGDYHINNDSRIFNLFYGQFRSTVSCLTCHTQSKTFNTFNCLHLQLPVARLSSLAQCLDLFIKPERIDSWHCKRCKCDRQAAKKIELWKLPPVLIVQFKRFRCEGIWTNKVQTPVDYPITNWDLSKYITGPAGQFSNFNLYGIINHSGSFESGHYTARCKNAQTGGGWFLYNDERVQELDRGSIKTKEAYVLLYTAVNFEEYLTKR